MAKENEEGERERSKHTWLMGSLGRTETGKRGQPRTLKRIFKSDFLLKTREKWDLSQFFHDLWPFFEQLLLLSSSSLMGSSDNGASLLISLSFSPSFLFFSSHWERENGSRRKMVRVGSVLKGAVFSSLCVVNFFYTLFWCVEFSLLLYLLFLFLFPSCSFFFLPFIIHYLPLLFAGGWKSRTERKCLFFPTYIGCILINVF